MSLLSLWHLFWTSTIVSAVLSLASYMGIVDGPLTQLQ